MQQCSLRGGGAARADGVTRSSVPLWHQGKVPLPLWSSNQAIAEADCPSRYPVYARLFSNDWQKESKWVKNPKAKQQPVSSTGSEEREKLPQLDLVSFCQNICVVCPDAAQKGLFYFPGLLCTHSKSWNVSVNLRNVPGNFVNLRPL